jgi:hypothetical protein
MTEQAQTVDPYSLSAEQATEKLAAMTKAYQATKKSDDPISDRYADNRHRIDRLVSGDPKERAKFDALMAKDPVAAGMSGDLPDVPSSEIKQIAAGANWLREIGLPDEAIHDFISGAPIEQSFRDQVSAWKSMSMKDGIFTKAYLAGESDAVRRMTVANAVLLSPIKETAA